MNFGQGKHVYELAEGWGKHFFSPFVEVPAVGVDSKDQVYVLIRGGDPVLVFDSNANFIKSFGRGLFTRPHGLWVEPNGSVYVSDINLHIVVKFSPEGEPIMTLGTKDHPSDTGYVRYTKDHMYPDYTSIRRAAGPFNRPTDIFVDKDANIYVSDGYGNARVHKFSKEGDLLFSWGEPGRGQGQFNVSHAICIDKNGIIYVADRENSRIQRFDPDYKYVDEWPSNRPNDVWIHGDCLYVAELGYIAGGWESTTTPKDGDMESRVTIYDLKGRIISQFGNKGAGIPGNFSAAHGLCVDSKGNLYVGETTISSFLFSTDRAEFGKYVKKTAGWPTLQKFIKKK